uniref:Uncharacterized protein n=1 Tax=Brassica oleracea var. oleracea TaxID=109376 RepID=A0A0D3CGN9_BRAOL
MRATSRSDAMRSLQTTSQSNLAGATPRSRSPSHPGGSRKLTWSASPERLGQSDTPRSLAFLSRDDNTMEPERPLRATH